MTEWEETQRQEEGGESALGNKKCHTHMMVRAHGDLWLCAAPEVHSSPRLWLDERS